MTNDGNDDDDDDGDDDDGCGDGGNDKVGRGGDEDDGDASPALHSSAVSRFASGLPSSMFWGSENIFCK